VRRHKGGGIGGGVAELSSWRKKVAMLVGATVGDNI
jgi:hypothetical protein